MTQQEMRKELEPGGNLKSWQGPMSAEDCELVAQVIKNEAERWQESRMIGIRRARSKTR
jgi:hypothetical protein